MDDIASTVTTGVSTAGGGVWSANQIFGEQLIASNVPEVAATAAGLGVFMCASYKVVDFAGDYV